MNAATSKVHSLIEIHESPLCGIAFAIVIIVHQIHEHFQIIITCQNHENLENHCDCQNYEILSKS